VTGPAAPAIELVDVTRRFGRFTALDRISLTVPRGAFLTILGPSGSGKTTTQRIIGGFDRPDRGRVHLFGADVTQLPPERRDTATVFQSGALFPHLTVLENVTYGLRMRGVPAAIAAARARAQLDIVRMADRAGHYPDQLSGGQKQRVALARALVVEPGIVLFDEPLSALDTALRHALRREIRELHQRLGFTAVFVTHDPDEAMALSSLIAVMVAGRLEQVGPPEQVYRAPVNARVHGLLGGSCRLTFQIAPDGRAETLQGRALDLSLLTAPVPGHYELCLRPGTIRAGPSDGPSNTIGGTVQSTEFLGDRLRLHVATGAGDLHCDLPPDSPVDRDLDLRLHWATADMCLFCSSGASA
jgi:ABC-type Fe3+/spermidine/putrescine transport system ATPase subunit